MQYALSSCICEFFLRETFISFFIISISGVSWFWQFLFLFHGTVQVYGFLRDIPVLRCSVRSQLFYSTTRSRLCNDVTGSWFLSDSHKYQWLPYVDCSHAYFNAYLHLWRASTKAVLLKHHFCCACLLICEFEGTTGVSVALDHRTLLIRSFADESVFQRVAWWTGTFPIVCWMHTSTCFFYLYLWVSLFLTEDCDVCKRAGSAWLCSCLLGPSTADVDLFAHMSRLVTHCWLCDVVYQTPLF